MGSSPHFSFANSYSFSSLNLFVSHKDKFNTSRSARLNSLRLALRSRNQPVWVLLPNRRSVIPMHAQGKDKFFKRCDLKQRTINNSKLIRAALKGSDEQIQKEFLNVRSLADDDEAPTGASWTYTGISYNVDPRVRAQEEPYKAQMFSTLFGAKNATTSSNSWIPPVDVNMKMDPKIQEGLDKVFSAVDKVSHLVDQTSHTFKSVVDYMCKSQNFPSELCDLVLQALIGLSNIVLAPNTLMKTTIALQLLLGLGFPLTSTALLLVESFIELISWVASKVPESIPDPLAKMEVSEEIKEQFPAAAEAIQKLKDTIPLEESDSWTAQGDETTTLFSKLHDSITSFFISIFDPENLTSIRDVAKYFSITDWVKKIVLVKSFAQAIEVLANYLWKFVSYIYEKLFGQPLVTNETRSTVDACVKWMTVASDYIKAAVKKDALTNDATLCAAIVKHQQVATDLLTRVTKHGYGQGNFTAFFKLVETFKVHSDVCQELLSQGNNKFEPLWIEFSGPPNIGKTRLVDKFTLDNYASYCDMVGMPCKGTVGTIRYEVDLEQMYWDRYRHQYCVTLDDVWQLTDITIRTMTAMGLIKMRNVAPMPLNCAAVEMKGKLFFDSKLLITTSNSIDAEGKLEEMQLDIQSYDALKRRCDMFVQVDINEGFYTKDFVMDNYGNAKIAKAPTAECLLEPEKGYKFKLWNKRTGKEITDWIDYDSMLAHANWIMLKKIEKSNKIKQLSTVEHARIVKPKELVLKAQGKFADAFTSAYEYVFPKGTKSIKRISRNFSGAANIVHSDGSLHVKSDAPLVSTPEGPAVVTDTDIYFVKDGKKELTAQAQTMMEEAVTTVAETLTQANKEACTLNSNVATPLAILASILGAIVGVFGAYKLWNRFFNSTSEIFTTQMTPGTPTDLGISRSGGGVKKTDVKKQPQSVPAGPRSFAMKAQMDQSAEMLAKSAILKNAVEICLYVQQADKATKCIKSYGLFYEDRTLGVPSHMIDPFKVKVTDNREAYQGFITITIRKISPEEVHSFQEIEFDLSKIKIYPDQHDDWTLLDLPRNCPQFTSIVQHFISYADLRNACISDAFILVPSREPKLRYTSAARLQGHVNYKSKYGSYSLQETLYYPIPTEDGECFSPVMVENTKIQGKIMGHHSAGSGKSGVACQMYREKLQSALDYIKQCRKQQQNLLSAQGAGTDESIDFICTVDPSKPPSFEYGPELRYLGKVPNQHFHRLNTESEIERSPIYEEVSDSTKKPAPLGPNKVTGQSPMNNALKRFKRNTTQTSVLTEDEVRDITRQVLRRIGDKVPWRKLTIGEAINGVPEWRFGNGLHMKKGAGFNATGLKPNGQKGKLFLFDVMVNPRGEVYYVPKPQFEDRIYWLEMQYQNGHFGISPAEVNLKDELRSNQRVSEYATRDFNCFETAHTVLGRVYMGSFIENLLESRRNTGITLGIDPFSNTEWDAVIKDHRIVDPRFLQGDVAHADRDQNEVIQRILREEIIVFLTEKGVLVSEADRYVVEGLLRDMTSDMTLIVGGDLVKPTGTHFGSGGFCTAHMQSLYYSIATYCAFIAANKRVITLTDNQDYEGLQDYYTNVIGAPQPFDYGIFERLSTVFPDDDIFWEHKNGDDFINIVSSTYSWFTCNVLAYELAQFGVEITPPDKTAKFKDFYEVHELEYLKRGWLYEFGICYAPLNLKTILEVLNWVNKRNDPIKQTELNCLWACYELWQHRRDVYNEWTPKIQAALRGIGSRLVLPTFDQISFDIQNGKRSELQFEEEFFAQGTGDLGDATKKLHTQKITITSWAQLYDMLENETHAFKYEHLNGEHHYADWKCWDPDFCYEGYGMNKYTARESLVQRLVFEFYQDSPAIGYDGEPGKEIPFIINKKGKKYYLTTDYYHNNLREFHAQMEDMQESVPTQVETTQLTTIVSDGQVEEMDQKDGVVHFYRQVDPFPDQGMKQVLSRKYRIATVPWAGSVAQNGLITTINFPYALIQIPNIKEKINRFHYFRSGVDIEILIAGTMYLFGTLIAAVVPFFKGNAVDPKTADVYTMSTLDHALVSPDSSTTTKLHIPWKSLTSYWRHDLDTDVGYIGTLVIRVLNPLRQQNGTSLPTAQVSIFASFSNPEVMGPTLHAQGKEVQPEEEVFHAQGKEEGLEEEEFHAQSQEQKAKSSQGLLSKGLEKGAAIASALSLVPSLSPIAQAGASILGGGAQLAKLFGYDKPNSIESSKPVYLTTANSLANANGMNVTNELAMDVENSVSNKPEDYGVSEVETNINVLTQRPGLFKTGTFTTTDVAGTVIEKWHNSPSIAFATIDGDGQLYCNHIPCSAVASFFTKWHGTMKYAIFFRCSKFQVAKIRVSWHATFSEIILSPEGEGDFPSQVYDICGDTTVFFSIPYCKNEPYSNVKAPYYSYAAEDQFAGAIAISIVNPVTAVDGTTTMPVYYNIYAACDDDMDFQGPGKNIGASQTNEYLWMDGNPLPGTLIAQGQGSLDKSCLPCDLFKKKFPSLFPATTHNFNKVCSGEQNKSILDLCHRFTANPFALTLTNNTPQFHKWNDHSNEAFVGNAPFTLPIEFFRYWAWFSRGGLNGKLTPWYDTTGMGATEGTIIVQNAYIQGLVSNDYQRYGVQGSVLENMHYKPCVEYSAPFYSRYPYHTKDYTHPTVYQTAQQPDTYNGVFFEYLQQGTDASVDVMWWLAVKDDFTFGYFRGCPRVINYGPVG